MGLDRQGMDLVFHQFTQRPIDQPLSLHAILASKGSGFDGQRKMTFAASVMAGMAQMMIAFIHQLHHRRFQRMGQAAHYFGCHGASSRFDHLAYIGRMGRKAYDGRVERPGECSVPGCRAPGEYRAPVTPGDFDGPGQHRLLCLDHVREHNATYDFFDGMSPEEIWAAQSPIPEHGRRVRQFAFTRGADPGPAWADFDDPLDAIAARFNGGGSLKEARASARFSAAEQHALGVLGLKTDTDLHAVRSRYSELVRRYHPDRNGGDRSHEARLGKVIDAWQTLRKAKAFA